MRSSRTESEGPPPQQPVRAVAALVVVMAVAVAFSPVILADYIRFDDYGHILENASLRQPPSEALSRFWSRPYFSLYIPITYSLWYLVAAGAQAFGGTLGQAPWAFHGLNLALHIVNALLVFLLIRTLAYRCRERELSADSGSDDTIAMTASILFALHPAQVEAVAWISECKGVLSSLFGLLGLYLYYRSTRRYSAVALLLAAGLAKPAAIVFPGIILLADRILLRKSLRASATLPLFAWMLILPIAVATKRLQPNLNMDFIPAFGERLLVAAHALGFYVWKLVAPYSLALDYGRSPQRVLAEMGGWRKVLPITVSLAGIIVAATAVLRPVRAGTRYAFLSCGWAIFAFSLVPVFGLVPFEFQDFSTVADRYMYIPMFGAGMAASGLAIRLQSRPTARAVLAIVVAVILAVSTFRQATRWRSTETLFAHTLSVNPLSYLAHYSIAAEKMGTGRLDEGIRDDLRALSIKPDFLPAEVALGIALIKKGLYADAIDHYDRALARHRTVAGKRAPLLASIHNNLGMALHQVGRHAEGTAHFRDAVEVDSRSVNGHINLGNAAFNDRRYLEAVGEYEYALALDPSDRSLAQQLMRARRAARDELLRAHPP